MMRPGRLLLMLWLLTLPVGRLLAEPLEAQGTGEAWALYERGKAALAAGRPGRALALLRSASELGPLATDVELHYWMGVASWRLESPGAALRAYARAVELDPDGTSTWSLYALENLAEVATRVNRLPESTAAYRLALTRETRPEWIEKIETQLAELALALGEYEPDAHTVRNERGEVIGGVGPTRMHTNRPFEIARHTSDPARQVEYYGLAIETDPTMYQAHFNLGLALTHLGRFREAIPHLERAEAVWQQDRDANPEALGKWDTHAFLALCRLELGEPEQAWSHTRRALRLQPGAFWAFLYSLRAELALGAAAEILTQVQGLAAEHPEHPEVLLTLAEAHWRLGDAAETLETLQAVRAAIPADHPWMGPTADTWHRGGGWLPAVQRRALTR